MSIDPSVATVIIFVLMWMSLIALGLGLARWYGALQKDEKRGFDLGL